LAERVGVEQEVFYSLRETRPLIYRDWDWWSWFLGRNYFGAASEASQWDTVERNIRTDLELHPGMKILDLGCGSGELVFRLAQRGMSVTGIDNSKRLIDDCRSIAVERGIPAEFLKTNMFEYTPQTRFDVALCINTSFGYGTDQENRRLFQEIANWLRPDGQLYLTVIIADYAESFGIWSDYLEGGTLIVENRYDSNAQLMTSWPYWLPPNEETMICSKIPECVRLYRIEEIESMLKGAGFIPHMLSSDPGYPSHSLGNKVTRTWVAQSGS